MFLIVEPARHTGITVLALFVSLCIFMTASAEARPLYGVQGVTGQASPSGVTDVERAAAAGLDVVRVQAFWAQLEPAASGQLDPGALAELDRVIGEAEQRGLRVVLFAVGSPCWNTLSPAATRLGCSNPTDPRLYRYQPARTKPFVDFSRFLVARYRKALAAYEIWNEPDQANELYWDGPNKAASYTRLVKAAYKPLKAVAPEVPVLAGSFVGVNGAWLQAMYAQGIKGHYDGLAVHFYAVPLYGLANTRAVQRRNRDSKPLWLTEYGFTSCYERGGAATRGPHRCVTKAQQATNVSELVNAVSRTPWIKSAILYTLRDETADYRFGLLDERGIPKAAYATLKRQLAGRLRAKPRQRLVLGASRGRLVVSGTGSSLEVLELRVFVSGRLRYRATLTTDRYNRFRTTLPAGVATRDVRASLRGDWTRRVTTARR